MQLLVSHGNKSGPNEQAEQSFNNLMQILVKMMGIIITVTTGQPP